MLNRWLDHRTCTEAFGHRRAVRLKRPESDSAGADEFRHTHCCSSMFRHVWVQRGQRHVCWNQLYITLKWKFSWFRLRMWQIKPQGSSFKSLSNTPLHTVCDTVTVGPTCWFVLLFNFCICASNITFYISFPLVKHSFFSQCYINKARMTSGCSSNQLSTAASPQYILSHSPY